MGIMPSLLTKPTVGFIPTTGLAIPFFSYGGSHTLFNLFSLGILLNISNLVCQKLFQLLDLSEWGFFEARYHEYP